MGRNGPDLGSLLPRGIANFIPGLGEGAGPPGGASGPGRTSDNTLSVTLFTLPRTLRLPVPWGIIPTGPKESAFECPMRVHMQQEAYQLVYGQLNWLKLKN